MLRCGDAVARVMGPANNKSRWWPLDLLVVGFINDGIAHQQ